MYTDISSRLEGYILGDARTFTAQIKFTGTNSVLAANIINFNTKQSTNAIDGRVTFGNAVASYADISMEAASVTEQLDGREFTLEIAAQDIPDYIPMGIYTFSKPKIEGGILKAAAYDRLISRCGGKFVPNRSAQTHSVHDAIYDVLEQTGLEFNGDISSLPEYSFYDTRGMSCKEVLGCIAGVYGKNAVIDRYGKVAFRWYEDCGVEIRPNCYYELEPAESNFVVRGIQNTIPGISTFREPSGSVDIDISVCNPMMDSVPLKDIWQKLQGWSYDPATIRFLGDPRLDTGDIVTVITPDGSSLSVPVMNLTVDWDGGLTSTAESARENEADATGGSVAGFSAAQSDGALAAAQAANSAAAAANLAAQEAYNAIEEMRQHGGNAAEGIVVADETNSINYLAKIKLINGKPAIEYSEIEIERE